METERVIHLLKLEKQYALKQRGFQQQPINKEIAEALEIAIEAVKQSENYISKDTYDAWLKSVKAMAEADLTQVKHGRWIDLGRNYYTVISQCSECGAKYDFRSPYCPNCGAKMEQILRIVDDEVKDVTTPELIKRYKHYFSNGYIDDDTEE